MKKYIDNELLDYMRNWPEPVFNDVKSDEYKIYRNKREALIMYASDIPLNEIYQSTGINRNQIKRMLDRCMTLDSDGMYIGFYALIPYYRLKESHQHRSIYSIMEEHPELSKEMCDIYFSRKSGPAVTPTKSYVFSRFHTRLLELGYGMDDYPRTLSDCGKRSFYSWLDRMEIENNLFIKRQSDNAKVHNKSTGVGDVIRLPRKPYELVEIDGHRLDLIYSVPIKDPSGNTELIPVSRAWLITAIDIYSRCIVGYALCFRDEYDQYDITRVIQNIIVPHITLDGIRRDGFPSTVFEECRYAVPDIIALDNALSHLANSVQDITYSLGIHLEYGPVDSPDRRPHIERFFGKLEDKWLHLMPSTTGSNKDDLRRLNPEKDGVKYAITRDTVVKVVESAIADYNNDYHLSIHATPMDFLASTLKNNVCPCRIPLNMRNNFNIKTRRRATIRGSATKGRRPYIQVFNHKYSFDIDTTTYSMVGLPVVIEFNPDDIRLLAVFDAADQYNQHQFDRSKHRLPKGQFIGFAKMTGVDADRPLSIENYKAINRYNLDNKPKNPESDATTNYIEGLKSRTDKKSVKELDNIAATLGNNYKPTLNADKDSEIQIKHAESSTGEAIDAILNSSLDKQNILNETAVENITSYEELRHNLWKKY